MIPAPFRHVIVDHLDHAIAALAELGDDAKLMAGGQSLIPLMKLRLASPTVVLDLCRLSLGGIRLDGTELVIGAMTTYRDVARSALVREHAPLLAAAAAVVGDPQVRNRGTIGGGLAHADPAGDVPCAVLALGGALVVRGPEGERVVSADDFFVGYWTSALGGAEVLVEVRIASRAGVGWDYQKFNIRSQDWATVAVAVSGSRVALASMADRVIRATQTEQILLAGGSIDSAAEVADANTEPPADLRATADYRRHLARVLSGDALRAAAKRGVVGKDVS